MQLHLSPGALGWVLIDLLPNGIIFVAVSVYNSTTLSMCRTSNTQLSSYRPLQSDSRR